MPPKPKFTREEIVASAVDLVSKKGIDYLTTRNLGEWMGSSARPIFTVFNSMDEVIREVRKAATEKFNSYIREIVSRDYGLNTEESKVLFQHMWTYTYGISALCATHMCMFPEKDITSRIGTEFLAITSLIKSGNMYTTTPNPVPGNNPKDFKTNEILDKIKEQSAK